MPFKRNKSATVRTLFYNSLCHYRYPRRTTFGDQVSLSERKWGHTLKKKFSMGKLFPDSKC